MNNESAKVFVSKLRERIYEQLHKECHSCEDVDCEIESLTVLQLLEMLEYMFSED